MKNKIKKIVTTTVVSALSLSAIGVGTSHKLAAHDADKYISNINALEHIETPSATKTVPNSHISSDAFLTLNINLFLRENIFYKL